MRREPFGERVCHSSQIGGGVGEEIIERKYYDKIGLLEVGESCVARASDCYTWLLSWSTNVPSICPDVELMMEVRTAIDLVARFSRSVLLRLVVGSYKADVRGYNFGRKDVTTRLPGIRDAEILSERRINKKKEGR